MAEPADMIVPMLREMRAEIGSFRGETKERFDILERRFKSLEEAQTSFKHALSAEVERRVRELESQS